MKHYYSVTVLLLSFMFMFLLSGCGQERIVYVPVTVTPEGGGESVQNSAQDQNLPPVLQVDEASPVPEATAAPQSTASDSQAERDGDAVAQTEQEAAPQANQSAEQPDDGQAAPAPSFNGEAARIAFMGPFGQSNVFHAYVVNPDGSGLTSVSEDLGEGYFPSLSPDGSRVLLVANTSVDPDIYVVDIASKESTNLTNLPGFDNQPIWSPDGKQIAFLSDREGGDTDIWVMAADGSNPRRLAKNPGEESMGAWSPDSKQIVYSNRDEVGEAIWIINVESGENTRLTESQTGKSDSSPSWSLDGKVIAYHSSENNTPPSIFTLRLDDSEQTQITTGEVASVFPIWGPDNQSLLYTEVVGDRRNIVAHNLVTGGKDILPNVQGFPNSWQPANELLADTGLTQGPKLAGVEVNPAILEAAYRIGDPNAPVTIIEFSDYQCPFCQRWYNDVYLKLKPYFEDGSVQLIFVDFPLQIHPQAPIAAQAAHCGGELAGQEGYWKMHDALFINMNQWSGSQNPAEIFNELATNAGLDGKAVQECVESERFSAKVDAGLQEGVKLDITGTPTFFVNGNRLVGAQPWEVFEQYLNQGG